LVSVETDGCSLSLPVVLADRRIGVWEQIHKGVVCSDEGDITADAVSVKIFFQKKIAGPGVEPGIPDYETGVIPFHYPAVFSPA
jgi:hypothetical protein